MKRTTTVAYHQLKPTVYIDAVPELARQRALFKERAAGSETNAGSDEVRGEVYRGYVNFPREANLLRYAG